MTFSQLDLIPPLLKAVKETGYKTPTPIQAGAIPPVLAGRDLIGCAQTGTGKTAAFALPILQRLSLRRTDRGGIRALILTPTRELALQIGDSFARYGKYMTLRSLVIFGGVGQQPQVDALKKGADILIACPGRLNDLIGQGYIRLDKIEIFVLDEADRMLDMGFIHDVKKVLAKLPQSRQNLLFSATMPVEIEELAASFLVDPAEVKVDPVSSTVERIDQSLYFVSKADKRRLLPYLIQTLGVKNALVFSRTKHGANRIAQDLVKAGIPAAAIHGNKSQSARVAALEGFKAGQTQVLVATDIAARGIDIIELSHVFNYDLPEVPETYVHRIGRTARAGADGTAVSFCTPEEEPYLKGIEKLNRKKIPVVTGHPWAAEAPAGRLPEPQPIPVAPDGKENQPVEHKKRPPRPEQTAGSPAGGRRNRRRGRSRPPQEETPAAPRAATAKQQPRLQQKQPQKPQPRPQKQAARQQPAPPAPEKAAPARQAPRVRQQPPVQSEDPGLILISRRAPAQKYSSFEEYINAHGGATAPIVSWDEQK